MYVCILNNNNTLCAQPPFATAVEPLCPHHRPLSALHQVPHIVIIVFFSPDFFSHFFFNFCLFHKVNVLGVFAAASLFAIAPEWGREMGWCVSVGWKRDGLYWGRLYGCVVQYLCVLGAGQDCGTCDALVACCLSLLICSYWFFFFFTSIICRDYTQHYT